MSRLATKPPTAVCNSATTRAGALDDALRRLFRSVETRALPQSLKAVLEQLDDRGLEQAVEGGR